MQIKIFTIPIIGGEGLEQEMNAFLRSRKVLQVESQLVPAKNGGYWSFCIQYLPGQVSKEAKVDYKEVLDQESFERFSKMRIIRKQIAKEEAIPAYAVFTDKELAELSQLSIPLTLEEMRKIKGVGAKKIEKYGSHFVGKKDGNETG